MSIFKPRPKPDPQPDPPPPPLEMHVVVWDGSSLIQGALISGFLSGEGWSVEGVPLTYFMLSFTLPTGVGYGTKVTLEVEATGFEEYAEDMTAVPDYNVNVHRPAPPARTGVVTLVGKEWRDEWGTFFPVGTTLFWSLGGWHRGDRDRVRQNLKFLQERKYDYYRMLAQVNWSGEEIDPTWPEYEQELADLIDCAYDEFCLRTQVTCVGGGALNPENLAQKVVRVVGPRKHKVIMLESVNEQNLDSDHAISMAQILRGLGLPFGVGMGNSSMTDIVQFNNAAGANVDYYHTERQPGDDGARQVRQGWNFKDFPHACVNNEPPGPASTVGGLDDPFKLAALRTLSAICGAYPFCLHTGTGVFGRPMAGAYGVRYSNLWEIPDAIYLFDTVRSACKRLPSDIGSWSKFNDGWVPPNPVSPVSISVGNVNKHYGARDYATNRFVSMPLGCVGPVTFKANEPMHLIVSHLITDEVIAERDLNVGEQVQVDGQWAYVLSGSTR